MEFLTSINFRLYVSEGEYAEWLNLLEIFVARRFKPMVTSLRHSSMSSPLSPTSGVLHANCKARANSSNIEPPTYFLTSLSPSVREKRSALTAFTADILHANQAKRHHIQSTDPPTTSFSSAPLLPALKPITPSSSPDNQLQNFSPANLNPLSFTVREVYHTPPTPTRSASAPFVEPVDFLFSKHPESSLDMSSYCLLFPQSLVAPASMTANVDTLSSS